MERYFIIFLAVIGGGLYILSIPAFIIWGLETGRRWPFMVAFLLAANLFTAEIWFLGRFLRSNA